MCNFLLHPFNVILYKANVPANPSFWDSNFGVTSLFGMKKFLQNNINNIVMFLLYIATFLNSRKLDNQDGNDIQQLSSFGKAAWQFILAIYESSWDQLYVMDEISFRFMVKLKFTKNMPQKTPLSQSFLMVV